MSAFLSLTIDFGKLIEELRIPDVVAVGVGVGRNSRDYEEGR